MDEVIRQLHERVSVRAFTPEPVSPEDEVAILEAACQAPTAGNQQLYSIIVVRSIMPRSLNLCTTSRMCSVVSVLFMSVRMCWLMCCIGRSR